MNIRVFVLLVNVLTLNGYDSRKWMNQYVEKCDKLSELYEELIDAMESPTNQPQIDNGETSEVNKPTVDTTENSRHNGNDKTTEPVTRNRHQTGLNRSGLENSMARLEQLMTMVYSGISDEKSSRGKNTQSVIAIKANVEDTLDDLKDETVMVSKHLTDLSHKFVEMNRKNQQANIKIERNLDKVSENVHNIVVHEATVEDELDVLKDETTQISRRLTDLSNKVVDFDRKNQQANDKIEQTMDKMSEILNKVIYANLKWNNVNIAQKKPAAQSSSTHSRSANVATDGMRNGNWEGGSCTHTSLQTNPWWRVDLQERYFINRVDIYNRLDCCGERLHDLTVTVSNTTAGEGTVCGYYKGPSTNGATETIQCAPNLYGQFLKIQMDGTDVLTLCEVEVYMF